MSREQLTVDRGVQIGELLLIPESIPVMTPEGATFVRRQAAAVEPFWIHDSGYRELEA